MEHAEVNREEILIKDGVIKNDMFNFNKTILNLPSLIKSKPKNRSWSHTVVNTESNCATLICQLNGEGNRKHYHNSWNEWWYIVQGQWEWWIEGETKKVKKGDIVFIEKNRWHKIKAIGKIPAIRLAVSRKDVEHIYDGE